MASRDIQDLVPDMQKKAKAVVDGCAKQGVKLLVYCTLRPLEEQARYYRRSRSYKEIKAKMDELKKRGLGFLADVIEKVGPQVGEWATNAAPGESWHNYGEAFDAVPLKGRKGLWNYKKHEHEWDVYGKVARQQKLEWGGTWRHKDFPHSQLREGGNPLDLYDAKTIKKMLTDRNLI